MTMDVIIVYAAITVLIMGLVMAKHETIVHTVIRTAMVACATTAYITNAAMTSHVYPIVLVTLAHEAFNHHMHDVIRTVAIIMAIGAISSVNTQEIAIDDTVAIVQNLLIAMTTLIKPKHGKYWPAMDAVAVFIGTWPQIGAFRNDFDNDIQRLGRVVLLLGTTLIGKNIQVHQAIHMITASPLVACALGVWHMYSSVSSNYDNTTPIHV